MRTTSHTCQALFVYLPRMAHQKSAVYLLLMPIFATFSTHFAKSVKIPTPSTLPNRTGSVLASSKETAGCERNAHNSAACEFRQFTRHSEQARPLLRSQLHYLQVTAITPRHEPSLGQFRELPLGKPQTTRSPAICCRTMTCRSTPSTPPTGR